MTAAELIEELSAFKGDTPVNIEFNNQDLDIRCVISIYDDLTRKSHVAISVDD